MSELTPRFALLCQLSIPSTAAATNALSLHEPFLFMLTQRVQRVAGA
jgi:hypothetical protein